MINVSTLITDSLYQVNLVLLMLQPSVNSPIKPILQQAGFKLTQIEPPLVLPVNLKNQLSKDNIAVSSPASPDLIIESETKEYVVFECKKSMFGSIPQPGKNDGYIKQARTFLLLTPKVLAKGLLLQEKDVLDSSLVYLSCHEPEHQQTKGLNEIAEQLNEVDYETIKFGLLGLSYSTNKIYLNKNYKPSFLPRKIASLFKSSTIVVQEIDDPENDPRSYYHIPWMPGSSDTRDKDKYSEKAFASAILQQATIVIAQSRPPAKVKLKFESLINLATNGFYQKWRDKNVRNKLITNTKDLLSKVLLTSVSKPELRYNPVAKAWEIDIEDEILQSQIIEAVRKWETKEWIELAQPELFPLI
jgi:hypothetical protein